MKKFCNGCKTDKPIRFFGKRKRRGRMVVISRCKDCVLRYRRRLWKKLNETLRGKYIEFQKTSKKRGLLWNLSFEDFQKIPHTCHYTGIPLTLKRNCANTLSLDRVDNKKGYTKQNCVFCCSTINYMKSDLSLRDFISLCRKVSRKFSQ